MFFPVDSQTIVIGSDDSSNTYSGGGDRVEYVPSSNSGSEEFDLDLAAQDMSHQTFIELVKLQEAKRLRKENAGEEYRMQVSDHDENIINFIHLNIQQNDDGEVIPENNSEVGHHHQQGDITTPVLSE